MDKAFVLALVLGLFLHGAAAAAPDAALSGKELFHYSDWTREQRSCAGCHPEGKGLANISDFDDAMLRTIVNACIRDALKAPMLPRDDPRLDALVRYLRSLKH